MSTDALVASAVTPAIAKAFIDQAIAKGYSHGTIAVRAQHSVSEESSFSYREQSVRIYPAVSALAIHEAIRETSADGWLVVITDCSDSDLGAGLLAQFAWQRVRHPDPWEAVKQRFAAQSVDAQLISAPAGRQVATGLLEITPAEGWSPAPAGVLTRDHAMTSAARTQLQFPDGPADLIAVLQWSTTPALARAISRLRGNAGDEITDAILSWIASQGGEAALYIQAMLHSGTPHDIVPLGVVLDCLITSPATDAQVVLARLQHLWGNVPESALRAAGRLSSVVVSGMLEGFTTRSDGMHLLNRADELLAGAQGQALAGGSKLLRSGLDVRLHDLASALGRQPNSGLAELEASWQRVEEHELAQVDNRVPTAAAGVRLARWLHTTDDAEMGLEQLANRQLDTDAWVDSAVNDAEGGVEDPALAAAVEHLIGHVQIRRDEHDAQFARSLAVQGVGQLKSPMPLEQVLGSAVVPLAKRAPVLLLVLDGMSAAIATEIMRGVAAALDYGLSEYWVPGQRRRLAGLSVLPSVTEFSRTSLLCGRLTSGNQSTERRGFADFIKAHHLGDTFLAHKKGLDASRPGFAVADDVRSAIANTARYKIVGCVLNTIDDALDRTDPGGTDWSAETIKHLDPLLRAARAANRIVVITSDHGHVVERRRGKQRGTGIGGRYRDASTPAGDDEVFVAGPRVLTDDHRAILAVNERLRYGPLKAGYHGGAAAAEVVVPILVLAGPDADDKLKPASLWTPDWWEAGYRPVADVAAAVSSDENVSPNQSTLFADSLAPESLAATGDTLIGSKGYRAQQKLVGRIAVSDQTVAALVNALVTATDRILTTSRAAAVLGVQQNRVPMVMSQISKLLNVEGYPVVWSDPITHAVHLDAALLSEQYGIGL